MSDNVNYAPTGVVKELYVNTGKNFVLVNNPKIVGNFVNHSNPSWRVLDTQNFVLEEVGNVNKRDILKMVTSPLGAKSEIFYKGSTQQNNPKLPINILTVSEIKNTEANKNLVETVKYTYENGKMYYDKNNIYDRRFAGFQKVTTETGTGANVKKIVKYFNQGDGDDVATYERGDSFHNIGRVYKEEVFGGTTKFAETYRTYGVYNWDGQVYKYPKLEVSTEFDASGNSFSKAVTYDYDLSTRLPKKTENFGEVKWDITTGNFQDVGEDYVLTKNIYNTKRPQKILAEESSDINGKFLDKKLYFYDELPFGYVEKGLLSEERNYSSANNYVKSTYTYHPTGLVATKTENNGAVTTFVYDDNYNPTKVTNALGQSATSQYNKILGVVTSSTNANGKVTNTVYDGFGNVKSISQTSPKDETVKLVATKNTTYSGNGMIETENVYSDGAIYKTSIKNYDSFGRLIKSQNTNTNNSNQTIDVTYNNLGQMVKVSYPYDSSGILAGYFSTQDTNYSYDSLGRNISVSQGDLTNYTDYIVNGKITRDNTPNQNRKEYKYNSLGKLSSVKEYTNASNANETKYEWNLLGNLIKLTDNLGNIRNFNYDSEGRLLKQEDLHAAADNTFGVYSYTYDVNGNLVSKKDPSGNVATFEYDILNRPKKESFGVVSNYVYDTCQNGVGSLCEVSNYNYTQKLRYNKAGQIFTETKNIDDKTFVQMYEYNDLGQNTKIFLPDSSYILYTYDVNGKQKSASLTRMIDSVASTTQIVTGASYNIDGTIKSFTSGNEVKTCYEYSANNGGNVLPRLSKINVVKGNDCNSTNLLFAQELKYNLFGSIVENKEIFGANNFNSGLQNDVVNKYEYDVLQRLVKSERLENNLNVVNNLSYNSIGNILSSDGTQYLYTGADYQNPHAPSIIGNTKMSYDLNGNILSDDKNQYEWNVKNTLKKVSNAKSVSEYTYDVSGERIKEVVKAKSTNSTSTFALNTGTENYFGEEVFTDFGNLGTTSTSNLFVSKTAYEEMKNIFNLATVTKQDVTNLLLSVNSTKFISETCAAIVSSQKENCERDNTLKVIYSKFKKEKNLEVSYGTLEEMWLLYKNKLKIDGEVYGSKKFKKILNDTSIDTDVFMEILNAGTPNGYQDYLHSSVCYIYQINVNATYTCNFIPKTWEYPKYENFDLDKANLQFLSGFNSPANFFKVGSLDNIDLASTTKFAANSKVIIPAINSNVWYQGYYIFNADITSLVKNQIQNNSKIGFKLFGKTNDNGTYYGQILNAYQFFGDSTLKPSISLEFKFKGEFKIYNSTSTKILANENVESYYNSFINNVKVQDVKKTSEKYISENSYLELEKNKLNSQNKIEALFAIALEGNKFVKETCKLPANVADTNCLKKEAIKFVASYLYIKHNIKLAANTLEEMYGVYLGDLKVSRNAIIYEKKEVRTLLTSPSNINCYLYQYTTNCVSTHNLSTANNKLVTGNFKYKIGGWFGGIAPVSVLINDETVVSANNSTELRNINLDAYIKKVSDAGRLENFKIEVRGTFADWSGIRTEVGEIVVKEMAYVNPKNINAQINPSVATSVLKEKVYGTFEQQDKNLLGAIYKQKKISSLFGSDRLLSKESFAEISAIPFTYSDLIIKDMLIDVSFAPYASCESISNEQQKRNCRKEIFVKYLFAIVKYEYDKELSTKALDELFEVTEGNLSIPNNIEDYKIRESKKYIINSTEITHVLAGYYAYAVNDNFYSQYRIGCQSGFSRPGQLNLDNVCDISFPVPSDLSARTNEIETATIVLFAAQGRGDYINPNVFNVGQVYLYPVISNNNFTYNGGQIPASALHTWNTNVNIKSSTENIKLGEATEVDVTSLVQGIAKGELNNLGLRIISTGNNIAFQNGGKYELKVNFAKDAPQNEAKFLTPLVTNPKDSAVYDDVLKVLARIDKEYKSQTNDIISKEAWNEIKNTGTTTTEKIKEIFNQNEKLQKDDTLAAVFQYYKTVNNVNLSRESLEELWMVANEKLSIPTDVNIYASTTNTTITIFDRSKLENLSVVPGVKSERLISDDNIYFVRKLVSAEGVQELKKVGIEKRMDILKYTKNSTTLNASSTISQAEKKSVLTNIFLEVASSTKINLSREALEEIYYIFNNKLILSNVDLLNANEKPELSKRSDFGVLEPLENVNSLNEEKLTNNIDYKVAESEIKIISDDTKGELKLVGISSREQIVEIMKLTKTVYKDSKISFFFNYIKDKNNYELSREALEEIYLIYSEKAIIVSEPEKQVTIKELQNVVNTKNPGCSLFMNSCEFEFEIKKKNGYNLISANLIFSGDFVAGGQNSWPVQLVVSGKKVSISNIVKLNSLAPLAYDQKYIGRLFISGFDQGTSVYLSANVKDPKIELTYEPIKNVFDKNNFGELSQISGLEKLAKTYEKEVESDSFGLSTSTASTSIRIVSNETLLELAKIASSTTNEEVKSWFTITPDNYSKLAKLYAVYLKHKTEKNVELSRLALEELWEINKGKVVIKAGPNVSPLTAKVAEKELIKDGLINKGGFSNFCLREGMDIENRMPERYNYRWSNSLAILATSEHANTNYKPTLEISYSLNGKTENRQIIANVKDTSIGNYAYPMDWRALRNNAFGGWGDGRPGLDNMLVGSGSYAPGGWTFIYRSYVGFDTTNIPKEAIIKSAKVKLTPIVVYNDWNDNTSYISLFKSRQVSANDVTVNDWKNCGESLDKPQDGIATKKLSELSANTSADFVFPGSEVSAVSTDIVKEKLTVADKYNGVASTYYMGYPYAQGSGYCGLFGYYESDCHLKFGGFKDKAGYELLSANLTLNYWSNSYGNFDVFVTTPKEDYQTGSYKNIQVDNSDNIKFTINNSYGAQPPQTLNITNLFKKSLNNQQKTNFDLTLKKYNNDFRSWQQIHFSTPFEGWWGIYGVKTPEIELTWKKKVIDPYEGMLPNDRNNYYEQTLINNLNKLEKFYNLETGITKVVIPENQQTKVIQIITPTETQIQTESIIPTLDEEEITTTTIPEISTNTQISNNTQTPTETTTQTTNTNQIQISNETLLLLNPHSYAFTPTSPTSIDIQINGATYDVNLDNYIQFYKDLESKNINTLAKYLNKVNNLSEEISYTKYYPSSLYEYDTRGYITINIPFNGKVVGTVKYSNTENSNLQEVSYIHNSYNATPVLLTNSMASTTEVIKRDTWGSVINNQLDSNQQIPTDFGYTGHKWDEQSSLTYAHARYLNNNSKVWLSHDPFSIENFSNGTWLGNPQLQNSYSYANNNPIMNVDPDGKISVENMQDFSAKIYNDGHEGDDLCNGCNLVSVDTGGFGMKAGVYSVTYFGYFTEYAVVFRGSRGVNPVDWLAGNLPQYVGLSLDEYAARAYTSGFKDAMPAGTNITTGGDSKGGGHAVSAGLANNLPAIVFNTAQINTLANGLTRKEKSYTNKISSNLIDGEFISKVSGAYTKPYINTTVQPSVYTPAKHVGSWGVVNLVKDTFSQMKSMIKNHSINNFKKQ